jgi:hypothetical protein
MGGLIVRSYLAGLNLASNTLSPPLHPPIRKIVFIATPHFGTDYSLPFSEQVTEMQYGSTLTWDLATWNQDGDDLRGIDALAIAGNPRVDSDGVVSDGVVAVQSASLDFVYPGRTRVIPYSHKDPSFLTTIATESCPGPAEGIADIQSRAHPSYQIIRSFLDGTSVWQTVGIPPAQATANRGGMDVVIHGPNDELEVPLLPIFLTAQGLNVTLKSGQLPFFVENDVPDPNGSLSFQLSGQSYTVPSTSVSGGCFFAEFIKFGPFLLAIGQLRAHRPERGALRPILWSRSTAIT